MQVAMLGPLEVRADSGSVAFFAELAEQGMDQLLARDQLPWLGRLTDDQDNLHAALRGRAAAGDAITALRLASSLGWYWWLRGLKAEGVELISEALAVPGPAAAELRAVACTMGALLSVDGADGQGMALDWFRTAANLTAEIPKPASPVLTLIGPLRAIFEATQGQDGPVPIDAIDTAVRSPDPWVGATARLIRGHLRLNFGLDHTAAEADFAAASGSYQALGERWGMAFTLMSLATLATWRGQFATAADHCEQALRLVDELGTMEDAVVIQAQLAKDRWLLGEYDLARAATAESIRAADRAGLPDLRAVAWLCAAQLARLDGEFDTARAHLAAAAGLATERSIAIQARALISSESGLLAGAEGDLDQARAQHGEALTAGRAARDAPVLAQVLVGLADLAVREGDPARAAELLGASLGVRGTGDLSLVDGERAAAAARAALGDAGYDTACQRGQAATLDELLSQAAPG